MPRAIKHVVRNQYKISTVGLVAPDLIAQNKGHQRVTVAALVDNGERGIRTPGPVARTQHFQCCTIGHSATSPSSKNTVTR